MKVKIQVIFNDVLVNSGECCTSEFNLMKVVCIDLAYAYGLLLVEQVHTLLISYRIISQSLVCSVRNNSKIHRKEEQTGENQR